jgi:hypothetical protein
MIKRLLINGLLTTGLQIAIYYAVLYFGWTIGKLVHEPTKLTLTEAIEFGLLIKLSLILFGTMLLVTNILAALINRRYLTWGLLCVITVLYLIGWGEDFEAWPWKTALFLVAGLFTIFTKFTIDKKLNGLILKSGQ